MLAIQILVGLSAIAGGSKLVMDPTGKAMELPLEWLNRSPFESYLIPGLALLIIVGLGNAAASLLVIFRHRVAQNASMAQGVFLIGYITVEVWFVGLRVTLQPLFLALGVLQVFLAASAHRQQRVAGLEGALNRG